MERILIFTLKILGFPSTEDGSDYEVTRVTEKIVEDKGKWALPENQDEVDDEKESEDNINGEEDEFNMNRKVYRHRALGGDDVKPTNIAISANWRSMLMSRMLHIIALNGLL